MLAAYVGAHKVLLEWTPDYDMMPMEHNLSAAVNKLMWDTLHFVVTLTSEMLFCIWIMSM